MTLARELSMRIEACDTIRREIHLCIDPLQLLTRSKNLHAMKEFGRY